MDRPDGFGPSNGGSIPSGSKYILGTNPLASKLEPQETHGA